MMMSFTSLLCFIGRKITMMIKRAVALRAIFVGGIVVFSKISGAVKAVGGVKVGVATAAMSAAATAISGSRKEAKTASQQSSK
ncbi:hypothetical protein RDI58_015937 [Solanum bulbocastanum]|uniref:Uncharacterized protein n=1 Tax=Solanum bulbocastanum TaxID=147425 RepID=A0AAN8TLF8_SOLBU